MLCVLYHAAPNIITHSTEE